MRILVAACLLSLSVPAFAGSTEIWSGRWDNGPNSIEVEQFGGTRRAVLDKQLALGAATIISRLNDNSRFELEIEVPDLPHDTSTPAWDVPRSGSPVKWIYLSYGGRSIAATGRAFGRSAGGKVQFMLAHDLATALARELGVPLRERGDLAANLDFRWKVQPSGTPGGPVELVLAITNRGKSVVGIEKVGANIGRLRITGRNDRGGKIVMIDDHRHDRGAITYERIEPGATLTVRFELSTYIELDEAGRYNLDIALAGRLTKNASDPFKTHRWEDMWELSLHDRASFEIR